MQSANPAHFQSNGKLLLTGEYLVLRGAKALALCAIFSQSLTVKAEPAVKGKIKWTALDHEGNLWFEGAFACNDERIEIVQSNDIAIADKLVEILQYIDQHSTVIKNKELVINSSVDFPRGWGLGTSSTLIANLAKWSGVDAYDLLGRTFGGSGYDVALAMAGNHIIYELSANKRSVETVHYNPSFSDSIFFVYLNKKRNSQSAVASFKEKADSEEVKLAIEKVNAITKKIATTNELEEFESAMAQHEEILAGILDEVPVKARLFADYKSGICKSLGAWGGDFILVTGKAEDMEYFRKKGFKTILSFKEMIYT